MEHGRNDDATEGALSRAMTAFGRFAGFLMLTVPALAVLGAVAVLPAYKNMRQTQWQRDCLLADVESGRDRVAANERLIAEASEDELLTLRLRMAQERVAPPNEVVVYDPAAPYSPPPGMIVPATRTRPAPPSGTLLRMADKLAKDDTRRGLFLLAAVALLAAMFLFSPPEKYVPESSKCEKVEPRA